MQKQFQKFGHFVFKNLNDEPVRTGTDKYVKYLYKKESRSAEKPHRRKIKSLNDAEDTNPPFTRKHSREEKYRSHRKRSSGSLRRARRRKDPFSNNSETEIYFISPEEIKKHRRKVVKNKEELKKLRDRSSSYRSSSPDQDERRAIRRKEEHFEKILKKQKQKQNNDDYQWLTKKEIFKLINNAKEEPKQTPGSKFFQKFFVFDKHTSDNTAEFIPMNDSHNKKVRRYSEDNTNMIFLPVQPCKKDKRRKEENSSREHPADLMYVRDPKRIKQKTTDNRVIEKCSAEVQTKTSKKRSSTPACDLVQDLKKEDAGNGRIVEKQEKKCGDSRSISKHTLEVVHKKASTNSKSSAHKIQANSQEVSSVNKSKKKVQDGHEESSKLHRSKEELAQRLQNISRANPLRHKSCLVKNTFSVVQILPALRADDNSLEKKKKLKAFKKYYNYSNANKDSEITISTTCHAFSDSHKMYQDTGEHVDVIKKKRHRRIRRPNSSERVDLQLETHVSSVVINPEPHRRQLDENGRDRKVKKTKAIPQKSKIPVLSNYAKIVELPRDPSPVSKSRRKSADLFQPKVVPCEEAPPKSDEIHEKPKKDKKIKRVLDDSGPDEKSRAYDAESVKEKSAGGGVKEISSKATSDRSSYINEKCNIVKAGKPQSVQNKTQEVDTCTKTRKKSQASTTPRAEKEAKVSNKLPVSKQSKASSVDDKSVKNATTSKSKNPSLDTSQKKSLGKTQKSTVESSNDAASTSWSRVSSRKSIKSSLASKSDTKIEGNKKDGLTKKRKTVEKSSAKTSVSNSTCGDKSNDSSKNGTSYLLTKTYRDDDKLNRWQKRKQYADNLRKNVLNKNAKAPVIPPQILEVRYLTVSNTNDHNIPQEVTQCGELQGSQILQTEDLSTKDFFENDLPQPCLEVVNSEKFNEFFALPVEEALNEILNENYNFLRKDFSLSIDIKNFSSDDDISTEDLLTERKVDDWYTFEMTNRESLSEISRCIKSPNELDSQNRILGSEDNIIDSLSAPGSEESGYSTIKSRKTSTCFFERPNIKALFDPPLEDTCIDYCVEVQIETTNSSSTCGLEIHSLESKSLQTTIECSQKSVQIKMSQELLEVVTTGDIKEHERVSEKTMILPAGDAHNVEENQERDYLKEENSNTVMEEQPQATTDTKSEVLQENPLEEKLKSPEAEDDNYSNDMVTTDVMTKNSESEKKKKCKSKQKKCKKRRSFLSYFSCISSNE